MTAIKDLNNEENFIEVKNASKIYSIHGKEFTAINNVNLTIKKGEFICLLGPSGCGKSTLLNAIAGFEKITSGSVKIAGVEVEKPSINYVTIFQNYGLLPWRTVQKNVELGLETLKVPKAERQERALKYLDLVGLKNFANSYPKQLSGGMQQRVSIARALAVEPEIVFLDEPFGALDAITRMKLQDDVRNINLTYKKTMIFVTHDIEEAIVLADRIVIMTPNPGKIKTIIEVPLPAERDRTSEDFWKIRDKVFKAFNCKPENAHDYEI